MDAGRCRCPGGERLPVAASTRDAVPQLGASRAVHGSLTSRASRAEPDGSDPHEPAVASVPARRSGGRSCTTHRVDTAACSTPGGAQAHAARRPEHRRGGRVPVATTQLPQTATVTDVHQQRSGLIVRARGRTRAQRPAISA